MKYILASIGLICLFNVKAQQIPLSSLYAYNKMMINPAETGLKKPVFVNLGHRQQWMGFEGAPITTWLTGQTRLNDNMGVGGGIVLDKMSFLERLNVNANYSYKVKFNSRHMTSFGVSLGMLQSKLNISGIQTDDYNDAVLLNTSSVTNFNADFGALYSFKKDLQVGLVFPQLIHKATDQSFNNNYDLAGHWIFYTSYEGNLDEKFSALPVLLIRNADKSNRQVELLMNIKYDKKIWGGFGFRQGGAFILNAGASVANRFGLTYSFEFDQASVAKSTSGTHELMLSFKFGKEPLTEEIEEEEGIEEPTERKAPTERF